MAKPMRIAVIHPGALGDLIIALPLMQTLVRASQPPARLDLFAAGGRGGFLAGRSAVTQGHSTDDPAFAGLFAGGRPPGLHPLGLCDLVINGLPGERFQRSLAGLLVRPRPPRIERLDVRPRSIEQAGRHASEFLHGQILPAGEKVSQDGAGSVGGQGGDTPLPEVTPTPADRQAAAKLLGPAALASNRPTALIHPGSGGRAKCWPLADFVRAAEQVESAGWRAKFVLGEAEAERMAGSDIASLANRFETFRDLTLGQLAGLMAGADAYLGNDSGPTHLAAAIGIATVALFGPTDPAIWGPRGRRVTIIRGAPAAGLDWGIDPADVAGAVVKSQTCRKL